MAHAMKKLEAASQMSTGVDRPPRYQTDAVNDGEILGRLQRDTFQYFLNESNPENGLVADNTRQGVPASIAAVGLALAAYLVGVERGYFTRSDAVTRTLSTLRFFWNSPHGNEPNAIGYHGFYYHFLDMQTGRRVWESELSTIDTTYVLAGALAAATYFDKDNEDEHEIRILADALYRRANWQWAQNGELLVSHGWAPEGGFLPYCWEGFCEATLLYVLGLGSPTYPLSAESYAAWTSTYAWRRIYDYEYLHAGPLFIHQLSHIWIDFRGIQDAFMRSKGIDYFENSRRATYVQQAYAIHNPLHYQGYDEHTWGITASDGPGLAIRHIDGRERRFFSYLARGVPDGPDDGTIAPWASIASLPFAPEIVLPTIRALDERYPYITSKYGFKCSFNPTFLNEASGGSGWISEGYYGLDQGPIVLMIENYRTGFLWRLMRRCPYIVEGLRRAGFTGGWLDDEG
jgi:hypothetical protein